MTHSVPYVALRLSKEGVNALFPEGTEYRLELQRSLIENLNKHYFASGVPKEMISYLDGRLKEEANKFRAESDEWFTKNFMRQNWGHRFIAIKPESDIGENINREIGSRMDSAFYQFVRDEIEVRMTKIKEEVFKKIDSQIAYAARHLKEENIEAEIQRRLKAAFRNVEQAQGEI